MRLAWVNSSLVASKHRTDDYYIVPRFPIIFKHNIREILEYTNYLQYK